MCDNSTVREMYNSTVDEMCDNSISINDGQSRVYTAKDLEYKIEKK